MKQGLNGRFSVSDLLATRTELEQCARQFKLMRTIVGILMHRTGATETEITEKELNEFSSKARVEQLELSIKGSGEGENQKLTLKLEKIE